MKRTSVPQPRRLDAGNNASTSTPGLSPVVEGAEGAEAAHLLARYGCGTIDHGLHLTPQYGIGGHARHVAHVVGLEPVHHIRLRVVAVCAEHDLGAREARLGPSDNSLEEGDDLLLRRSLSRTHDRGDQPPGYAFVHMERHQAVLVVVRVEQGQLLVAVDTVGGRVHVDDHAVGGARVAVQEVVHERVEQSDQITHPDVVLETSHRGLRGKRAVVGAASRRNLQHCVLPHGIAVVGILVAMADLHCPLREELLERVLDMRLVAVVPDRADHRVEDAIHLRRLTQQQRAAIRAQFRLVEYGLHSDTAKAGEFHLSGDAVQSGLRRGVRGHMVLRVVGLVCQAVAILLVYHANAHLQPIKASNRSICEIISPAISGRA